MSKSLDKKEKKTPEEVVGTNAPDDALESFLSRGEQPEKDAPSAKPKKLSRRAAALIAAIAVVAVLIIIVVIIANQPVVGSDADIPIQAQLATTVDEQGEHHVEVSTDENGDIKQNGYGELVSYVPSQIVRIDVENTDGSFTVTAETPEGEATVYTLVGFENYELQPGMADAVANDASTLSFTSIVAIGAKPADFGLDKPRATVKVTYIDNTTAVIRVGREADGGAGVYAALGDSDDVFLVSSDAVDAFLYSVLDLISCDISPAAQTVDDGESSLIEIAGSRYPDPITLVPNTDEVFKNYYRLTSPYEMLADNYEGNDISGSIRDLYAESVVCVNPSSGQLSSFGVDKPYASVHAVYPDVEINLCCSAPADDGLVNLYNPDKGVIYTIRVDALGWARTNLERLLPQTVIELNKSAVTGLTVVSGGKTYTFEAVTTVKTEDDVEVTTTAAKLNGKKIPEDSFNIFFQNLNGMKNLGEPDESGSSIVYEARLSYNTGRADDVVSIYDTGGSSCPVALNHILIGSVSKSHLSGMQKDLTDIADGKIPANL